jgi:hypothetical protein
MTDGKLQNWNWTRSAVAVAAGMVTAIVLSLAADQVLRAVGLFAPQGQTMPETMFVLATAHRTIFGVVGSYVTARLAPGYPMMHALLLGGLGLVANLAGLAVAWSVGRAMGPLWYPAALVALSMPNAWVGGWLGRRHGEATQKTE